MQIEKIADNIGGRTFGQNRSGGSTNDISATYSISDLFAFVKQHDAEFSPKPVNKALLNEDGTPRMFYHGTNQGDFTEFLWEETQRADGGFYGRGHYFTNSREMAKRYGKRGNVAVVVQKTGKNKYHMHRILMPDGSKFVYENIQQNAEPTGDSIARENPHKGLSIGSASNISIAQNSEKSTPSAQEIPGNGAVGLKSDPEDDVDYVDYDKPITIRDVDILRSIGRKSIKEFSSEKKIPQFEAYRKSS